ncbi:hypothetical protein FE257_001721 [Aspergillus nanangensis]|uniref:Uncharacterized protein n=1 Tax=Aspergillus nanangensis TaxID=2582783 RepID=A0AAD4CDH0_ASPNN|nr:hypothetical protein FE257_001721 [Aspergillus nanangensis]
MLISATPLQLPCRSKPSRDGIASSGLLVAPTSLSASNLFLEKFWVSHGASLTRLQYGSGCHVGDLLVVLYWVR